MNKQNDLIKSNIAALYSTAPVEDSIEKGGEGSKGGKVIGHTKSGKPIYLNKTAHNKAYENFTKEDHQDAADVHDECNESPRRGRGGASESEKGDGHSAAANSMKKSEDTILGHHINENLSIRKSQIANVYADQNLEKGGVGS